jgi:hypothetical protein
MRKIHNLLTVYPEEIFIRQPGIEIGKCSVDQHFAITEVGFGVVSARFKNPNITKFNQFARLAVALQYFVVQG